MSFPYSQFFKFITLILTYTQVPPDTPRYSCDSRGKFPKASNYYLTDYKRHAAIHIFLFFIKEITYSPPLPVVGQQFADTNVIMQFEKGGHT